MKRKTRTLLSIAFALFWVISSIYYWWRHKSSAPVTPIIGSLPEMLVKPEPVARAFKGCPPEGDGGDPALNRLKNREDTSDYLPVPFEAVAQLAWPPSVARRDHAKWSASDAAAVAHYEGLPIAVEGYLAQVKEEGPESPNCHGAEHEFHDLHLWLVKAAGDDRTHSIVVEATPKGRDKHPAWSLDRLRQIIRQQQHVRISGWLMLDPEHPDQVGKTRGTIWELHPIMRIEVEQGNQWITLDSPGA
jgi:hypothetical protein